MCSAARNFQWKDIQYCNYFTVYLFIFKAVHLYSCEHSQDYFARCKQHWSKSTSCFRFLTPHKSWDKIQPTEHMKLNQKVKQTSLRCFLYMWNKENSYKPVLFTSCKMVYRDKTKDDRQRTDWIGKAIGKTMWLQLSIPFTSAKPILTDYVQSLTLIQNLHNNKKKTFLEEAWF